MTSRILLLLFLISSKICASTYTNPLKISFEGNRVVQSCADPSIIPTQTRNDISWYAFCTTDPIEEGDVDANGKLRLHYIPILHSKDLVSWKYVGDVFKDRPRWAPEGAAFWAPEIQKVADHYLLYYAVFNPDGTSAIRVARSKTPVGPWSDVGQVIEPHEAPCCPGLRQAVLDPEVIETARHKYIFYGSYEGGIHVRPLSVDGLQSDTAQERQVTASRRYEAPKLVHRGKWWYLFVSATNCCAGALTGYSVFAGRSLDPLGPFLDKEGVSLLAERVGGTPVVSMNGNRWVGPGHNDVVTDASGQDWLFYHAIDRHDPQFAKRPDISKRRLLMDRLDWIDGWPTVRKGLWASDSPQQGPLLSPRGGDRLSRQGITRPPQKKATAKHRPGILLPEYSIDFRRERLSDRWHWTRQPQPALVQYAEGGLQLSTQTGDIVRGQNTASILAEPAPQGDYLVETLVWFNVPGAACCNHFPQAGLVLHATDDNYVKLTLTAMFGTEQTEFGIERASAEGSGAGEYGNTVVGPPGNATFLRIAKRTCGSDELYTPYTSRDGATWVRGGTWTHKLGRVAKIGLVAMGGAGYKSVFDYVRVSTIGANIDSAINCPSTQGR